MKFFDYVSKLKADLRLVIISNIVLSLALGVLAIAFAILYSKKTVVIVPPKIEKEFWVAGEVLSRSYLEQVSLFIADRVMNVSPANVEYSVASVYPFLTTSPTALKKLKEFFALYTEEIKENSYWQSFYPVRVDIIPKHRKVVVTGIVKKISGNVYLGESRKSVEIVYKVKNGRFLLEELSIK